MTLSNDPEHPCTLCRGEGAIGTGLGNSFVDASDAMECPRCEGSGEEPRTPALPGKDA